MDVDAVVTEVASAVGLAEGRSGVRDVMRAIARSEPVATREVSRQAELPIPLVTAVCNELRKRGVVDRGQPVRLTPEGRAALNLPPRPDGSAGISGQCPCCAGRGVVVPEAAAALTAQLERLSAGIPGVKLELDQTHCTVPTKIHRVLRMHEAGALDGKAVIVLGDDDLTALAVAAFCALPGSGPGSAADPVVDTDADLLAFIGNRVAGAGTEVELCQHDLREPLPGGLLGVFDVACTDPPYTVAGAELFLSRAVSALTADAGQHVFFSFRCPPSGGNPAHPGADRADGADRAGAAARLQRVPGGGCAGRHQPPVPPAHHGRGRAADHRRLPGAAVHGGPPGRSPALPLRGLRRGAPGRAGRALGDDQRAEGGWLPGVRGHGVPADAAGGPVTTGPATGQVRAAGSGYLIRPAGDADLDAVAAFEVDIARVSFGDDAITDAGLHRKRVAGALGKPGEVTVVAAAAGAPSVPVGWAWLSGRTNSLTGARYGNFRSLAVADMPGPRGRGGTVDGSGSCRRGGRWIASAHR